MSLSKRRTCGEVWGRLQAGAAPARCGSWPVPHVLRRQGYPEPIHVSEMFGRRFRTHRTTTTGKSDEERDGTRGFRAGIAW